MSAQSQKSAVARAGGEATLSLFLLLGGQGIRRPCPIQGAAAAEEVAAAGRTAAWK